MILSVISLRGELTFPPLTLPNFNLDGNLCYTYCCTHYEHTHGVLPTPMSYNTGVVVFTIILTVANRCLQDICEVVVLNHCQHFLGMWVVFIPRPRNCSLPVISDFHDYFYR